MEQSIDKLAREAEGVFLLAAARFWSSLRHNQSLAILALLLSIALWALITNEENPPKTDIFPTGIPIQKVNVPKDLDAPGEIEPVHVRVTAPLGFWLKLSADHFEATVDLLGMTAGQNQVPVKVKARDSRIKILEVIPPQVSVSLEALETQQVPVRANLQGSVPFGYSFDMPRFSPKQATIRGPKSLVAQVDAVVADVDLEGRKESIDQSFRLLPRTARGYEVRGVDVDPATLKVAVPIQQLIGYLSFPVVPELKGEVARGYWITGMRVRPANVTVVGSRDVLSAIDYLSTLPVDASQATTDVVKTVGLKLPKGVNLVGIEAVAVEVTVAPVPGSLTLSVTVSLEGPSQFVTLSPDTVLATVSGETPTLNRLSPTDIKAVAKLAGLEPGFHLVRLQVSAPPGIKVDTVEPNVVGVTLKAP
ncbi:MAG: hypothetical protein HYU86_03135 [Chloroflexi bacterium]|nr:hypothetical protein [Chloroflexota bacterium]